jgi:hypothetical protein
MLGEKVIQQFRIGSNGTIQPITDNTKAFATVTFDWAVTNQNVVTNQSTINWSLSVAMTSDATALKYTANQIYKRWYSSGWDKASITAIDFGNKYESDEYDNTYAYYVDLYLNGSWEKRLSYKNGYYATLKPGESITLTSGTTTVTHNSDGTLPIKFRYMAGPSIFYADNGEYATTGVNGLNANSPSKMIKEMTYDLDVISRHAMLYSVPTEFNDEQSPAIEYAVPSGLTGKIYMSLDGNVNTETTHLVSVTGQGTINYSFTQADLDKIWKIQDEGLRHKGVKFCIKSTSDIDGVEYREHLPATLKLINYDPTLDVQVYDSNTDVINRLTGNRDVLVRNLSNAYCNSGGKAVKGSTINTETVKCAGETRKGAVNTFEGVQGNIFEFAIVDNHGNPNQYTKEFSVELGKFIEYVKPTANISVTEVTGDGKVAITVYGKYYKGGFGKVDNQLKITWRLDEHNTLFDSGTFEDVYVDVDADNNYSYTFQRTNLNYLDVYELTVGVSDTAVTSEVYAEAIIAAVPVFDWGRQDFAFNVPVTIQGASVPSIVEQGTNYTGWTYRKWSDGFAECWLTKELTSVKIQTASGNGYSSGAISASNVSFPVTFTARPTVIATLMANGNPAFLSPSTTAATTEQTGTYQLNSMSSVASKNYLITYDVKGRWK